MSSTNSDPTSRDYVLIATAATFLSGLAFETAVRGLVQGWKRRQTATVIKATITITNLSIMAFTVAFVMSNIASESNCVLISTSSTVAFHFLFFAFGSFILYKSWVIASHRTIFTVVVVVLLVNRAVWGILDIVSCYQVYEDGICNCIQDQLSGLGFMISDLTINLVCTIATLIESRNHKTESMKGLFSVLLTEDLIRTVFALVLSAFAIYMNYSPPFWMMIQVAFQTYVYAYLVNAEYYWAKKRTDVLQKTDAWEEIVV